MVNHVIDQEEKMLTNLRVVRMSKGLKLSELANHIGISVSFMSKIELGKLKGSIKTREKISRAVGVDPKILFGRK